MLGDFYFYYTVTDTVGHGVMFILIASFCEFGLQKFRLVHSWNRHCIKEVNQQDVGIISQTVRSGNGPYIKNIGATIIIIGLSPLCFCLNDTNNESKSSLH